MPTPVTITRYKCKYCGTKFNDEKDAQFCEERYEQNEIIRQILIPNSVIQFTTKWESDTKIYTFPILRIRKYYKFNNEDKCCCHQAWEAESATSNDWFVFDGSWKLLNCWSFWEAYKQIGYTVDDNFFKYIKFNDYPVEVQQELRRIFEYDMEIRKSSYEGMNKEDYVALLSNLYRQLNYPKEIRRHIFIEEIPDD